MEISKEEFKDWYHSIVTTTLMGTLVERREVLKERLANSAGLDSYQDAKDTGYIQAITDILDVSYGDLE